MALIKESKNNDWTKGLSYKVIETLQAKHQPEDTISRVELRNNLNGVKMETKDDPQELMVPEKYQSNLALEQVIKGKNVTLDDLKK
eukprot:14140992-Ditylum_brightwellii.AAC.1